MIKVSEDIELVSEIRDKLKENKQLYGKAYCPCVLPSQRDDDHVCMCKPFREQDSGECHCGLYVKIKD